MKENGETLVMKLLLYSNFFQSPAQGLVNLFSVILFFFFFKSKLYELKNENCLGISRKPYSMLLMAKIIKMKPKSGGTAFVKSLLQFSRIFLSQEEAEALRRKQCQKKKHTWRDERKWSRTREARPYLQRVET